MKPIQKSTHIYKSTTAAGSTTAACPIRADVFLPPAANPPVVVYFHGGALISGSRSYLPAYQAARLVEAGLAVVSCDYRLAPETKLAEIVGDIEDALGWVMGPGAALCGFDPARVAVMGASAGGYLSLLSGTLAVKPKAIVSFYGYGDILGEWYTRPSGYYCAAMPPITRAEALSVVGGREKSSGGNRRYTYYFYCRQQGTWPEAVSGVDPLTERERLLRFCPVENITPDYPPTLLLHGDRDDDVPYAQSVQMAAALERHGIEHRLITVEGGGHMFDGDGKKTGVREIFEEVVAFLMRPLHPGEIHRR